MDCGQNSDGRGLTPVTADSTAAQAIACDQAIYTSIRSPTGQGYRMIAASRGIETRQRGQITKLAPAVDGLCHQAAEATGISFFPITGERFAVLHTCHAGKEPSGRGGLRTYTRIFVTDAAGLRRFDNNPFAMIRAVRQAGGLVIDLKPKPTLPEIVIDPSAGATPEDRLMPAETLGARRVAHVLEKLMTDESLVVSFEDDLIALTEAILVAMPAPLRASISFSAGIPFSVSRRHRLVVCQGHDENTEMKLRGSAYTFTNLTTRNDNAPAIDHPWARVAERMLGTRENRSLLAASTDRFTNDDFDALERIGETCLAYDDAASARPETLLDLVLPYVGRIDATPAEREWIDRIMGRVRDRLEAWIQQANADSVTTLWRSLLQFAAQSPALADFACPIAPPVMIRLSDRTPLAAMRLLLNASESVCVEHEFDAFVDVRKTVSNNVSAWSRRADASELAAALPLVNAWHERFPNDETATRTLSAINDRLVVDEPVEKRPTHRAV